MVLYKNTQNSTYLSSRQTFWQGLWTSAETVGTRCTQSHLATLGTPLKRKCKHMSKYRTQLNRMLCEHCQSLFTLQFKNGYWNINVHTKHCNALWSSTKIIKCYSISTLLLLTNRKLRIQICHLYFVLQIVETDVETSVALRFWKQFPGTDTVFWKIQKSCHKYHYVKTHYANLLCKNY